MEDDLLDVILVATTGIVCFFIALIFNFYISPALLCGVVGSAAQAALIRAVYPVKRKGLHFSPRLADEDTTRAPSFLLSYLSAAQYHQLVGQPHSVAYTLENAPDEVHNELMTGLDAIISGDTPDA